MLVPYRLGAKVWDHEASWGPLARRLNHQPYDELSLDLSRSRNASAMASLHEDPGIMFKIRDPGGEPIVRAEMPWAGSKWPASVLYSYLRGFPSK